MKKSKLLLCALTLLMAAGCSEEPDTELFYKDVDIIVPVGELKEMKLGEIISLGSSSTVMKEAENGDYSVDFNAAGFNLPVVVPAPVAGGELPLNFTLMSGFTLPDFFVESGSEIVLGDVAVEINVSNPSPADLSLSGVIAGFNAAEETVRIGLKDIFIPGGVDSRIVISTTGERGGTDDIKVKEPNLGLLFCNPVADRLELRDAVLTVNSTAAGDPQRYEVNFNTSIKAPLAFGDGTKLKSVYNVNLGLADESGSTEDGDSDEESEDSGIHLEKITVKFAAQNSLPLDVKMVAKVCDKDGVVLEGIEISSDADIKAGTLSNPSLTDGCFIIKGDFAQMTEVDGLKIEMDLSSGGSGFTLIPINSNQGLQLKNLRVGLKGSIRIYND